MPLSRGRIGWTHRRWRGRFSWLRLADRHFRSRVFFFRERAVVGFRLVVSRRDGLPCWSLFMFFDAPRLLGRLFSATAFAPVLDIGGRRKDDRKFLPVEVDAGVLFLERSAHRFVKRLAADFETWRCPEHVQYAWRAAFAALAGPSHQINVLVATFVAGDANEGHHRKLFPLRGMRRLLRRLALRRHFSSCGTPRRRCRSFSPNRCCRRWRWCDGRRCGRRGRRPCNCAEASRWDLATPVHERETHLVADGVIAPDFGDLDLVVFCEPTGDVDHSGRHIKVKRCPQFPEMRPLSECFQMVDRFGGFDLDHCLKPLSALERRQNKVGKKRGAPRADRRVLLSSRVHARVVLAPALGVQQSDDTVVLELFADGPDQDRAHQTPPPSSGSTGGPFEAETTSGKGRVKTPKCNMGLSLRVLPCLSLLQ